MQSAHNRFASNIARARDLQAMFVNLKANTAGIFDLTDILRASIVSAVSAFDTFIHEITRIGMLEILQKVRPRTDGFGRFDISMNNVLLVVETPGNTQWFEDEIRARHSWLSFQQPDKVADAIRLFSSKELWKEVGSRLGIDPKTAKKRLALIIDRRNKIAHEADMDPSSPDSRWPIDDLLVRDAINTLQQIADAIMEVVRTP